MQRDELRDLQLRWNLLIDTLEFPPELRLPLKGEERVTTNWGTVFRNQWMVKERNDAQMAHTRRGLDQMVAFCKAEIDREPSHARDRLCHACREGTLIFGTGDERYRDPHLTCSDCLQRFRTDLTPLETEFAWRDGISMPTELLKELPKPRRRQPGARNVKREVEG